MAVTTLTSSDANAIKLWELKTMRGMLLETAFGRLASTGAIYFPDAMKSKNKNAGDTVTIPFGNRLSSPGVGEGGTLEGSEEAGTYRSFSIALGEHRKAVRSPIKGAIEQIRANVDFEVNDRENLSEYFSAAMDASLLQQLAGAYPTQITVDDIVFAGTDRLRVTGENAVTAPTSGRVLRAGAAATDQALGASDTLTIDLLDAALEATRTYPKINKLSNGGYDLYISPEQYTDLLRDNAGKIQLLPILQSEIAGGKTNALNNKEIPYGIKSVHSYQGINIIVSDRVPTGVNSSTSAPIANVRRAVLVGRSAVCWMSPTMPKISGSQKAPLVQMTAEEFDYGHELGIGGAMVYGAKKTVFSDSGEDFGVITIPTYAAPHTS